MSFKKIFCSFVIVILVHGAGVGFAANKDEQRDRKEQGSKRNLINSSNWHELPMRAAGNHVSPTFNGNAIEWNLAKPSSWTRSEIALNRTLPQNFSAEFEWKWTGGGSIEIFFPNSDEILPDNWYPQKWYGVYISSENMPDLHIYRRPSDDPEIGYFSPAIESSSEYKNAWVTVKIEKKGREWSFYRNGKLIDRRTFGVLARHEIGLIFAPSHNDNMGPDANIVLRSVVIRKL
jgi:hypothetical protein